MDTCESFVRKIRAKCDSGTDYAVAKAIKVRPQTIHSWKQRGSVFSDDTGQAIADYLGYTPEYVLICLNAERAQRDKDDRSKKTYEKILRLFSSFSKSAAATLLVLVFVFGHTEAGAGFNITQNYAKPQAKYTLCELLRRIWNLFKRPGHNITAVTT